MDGLLEAFDQRAFRAHTANSDWPGVPEPFAPYQKCHRQADEGFPNCPSEDTFA
jgi:hypothetical protein